MKLITNPPVLFGDFGSKTESISPCYFLANDLSIEQIVAHLKNAEMSALLANADLCVRCYDCNTVV